jgi:hypothetical protein
MGGITHQVKRSVWKKNDRHIKDVSTLRGGICGPHLQTQPDLYINTGIPADYRKQWRDRT